MIAGMKRAGAGHKIGDCPLFAGIGRTIKDSARTAAIYTAIGAAALIGAARASDAATPSVYVVPENGIKQLDGSYKATVNRGQPSFFDVYINSNGARVYGMDTDISYSTNNNLTNISASILTGDFWQGKDLEGPPFSSVSGFSGNSIILKNGTRTYDNSINTDDAAFRVNFTAGQDLGKTNISIDYADLLTKNLAETSIYYSTDGTYEPMNAYNSSIEVTPEPATIALLGLGSLGTLALRRKKAE